MFNIKSITYIIIFFTIISFIYTLGSKNERQKCQIKINNMIADYQNTVIKEKEKQEKINQELMLEKEKEQKILDEIASRKKDKVNKQIKDKNNDIQLTPELIILFNEAVN